MAKPAATGPRAQAEPWVDDGEASDLEYGQPLQYKRAFGAGIKRKRIDFVPQSGPSHSLSQAPKHGVGDMYLSTVLPSCGRADASNLESAHVPAEAPFYDKVLHQPVLPAVKGEGPPSDSEAVCEVCRLPVISASAAQHTVTLAHQVCLPHSHPPSHLDRQRKGLSYLSSYGWDPDARLGLGAQGDGRLHPVKAKERETNLGIGAEEGKKLKVKDEIRREQQTRKERLRADKAKKARDVKMQMLLFGKDEVNKQLGVEL